jgi:hypothetical protein
LKYEAINPEANSAGTYVGPGFRLSLHTPDGQPITSLLRPYRLTVAYDPQLITALGQPEQDLNLAYRMDDRWVPLLPQTDGGVDLNAHRLVAQTDQLTDFMLVLHPLRRNFVPVILQGF